MTKIYFRRFFQTFLCQFCTIYNFAVIVKRAKATGWNRNVQTCCCCECFSCEQFTE